MATITQINPKRADGYPIINEISANKKPVTSNAKDPVYLRPLSALTSDYSIKTTGVLIFKIK